MNLQKLAQYGFPLLFLLSLIVLIHSGVPNQLRGLRHNKRFNTAMQLHKQFGNLIGDSEPPVIGILTQGTTDMQYYDNHTMIAASYIRYIEAAGGKVVAVPYNLNETELERIYQNINGLLIPGGRMKLVLPVNKTDNSTDREMKMSMFARAAKFFVDRSMEDFSRGVYFPIFGICLGQEAISLALNLDPKHTLTFLNLTSNKYQSAAGAFNPDVKKKAYRSRIFKSFTDSELEAFENKSKFFFHHKYGVTMDTFEKSEPLKKYMIPLTTMKDFNDTEYITSFELYSYPIFGVQFHPEKTSFEWSIKTDRSPETISITHKLAANFIDECRKNNHRVSDEYLIKNLTVYKHLMMGPKNGYSMLFYFSKTKIKEIMNFKNDTNITEVPQNVSLSDMEGQAEASGELNPVEIQNEVAPQDLVNLYISEEIKGMQPGLLSQNIAEAFSDIKSEVLTDNDSFELFGNQSEILGIQDVVETTVKQLQDSLEIVPEGLYGENSSQSSDEKSLESSKESEPSVQIYESL